MLTGRRRPWRPQLTRAEQGRGWVFFALYVFLFPWLMGWVQRSYQGEFPVAEANVVYYLIIAALTFLVFWSYLRHGFRLLLDWLPENLFALITGLAGGELLRLLVSLIPLPVEDPNLTIYPEQFAFAPAATVFILVVLIPLVEEPLFRGALHHRPELQPGAGLCAVGGGVRPLLRRPVRVYLRRTGPALSAADGAVPAGGAGTHLVLRPGRLHLERHRSAHAL